MEKFIIFITLSVFMHGMTEASALPPSATTSASSKDCLTKPCPSEKISQKAEDVTTEATESLSGIRKEIESKYNELEEYVISKLRPSECTELVRLLFCKGLPLRIPRNVSSAICDASSGHGSNGEKGKFRIHDAKECRSHLQAWVSAFREALVSENPAYRFGLNHIRKSIMDRSAAMATTGLNRARKLFQDHNLNILVRGAMQPVEFEKFAMRMSPNEEKLDNDRPPFTIIARRIELGSEGMVKVNNKPLLQRRWNPPSPFFRPRNYSRRIVYSKLLPSSLRLSRQTPKTSTSSPAPPPPPPRAIQARIFPSLYERLQNSSINYNSEDAVLRTHKIFALVAPVVLMLSMAIFLLWLCCNFRGFVAQRLPPPPYHSYNFKYAAVPGQDLQKDLKEKCPVQGFVGALNSQHYMMQHI